MDAKKKFGEALRVFWQEFWFPERFAMDGAPDQVGRNSAIMKEVRKQGIDFQVIKPERHNQNTSEGIIQEIWRKWFRVMFWKKVLKEFWDYGIWFSNVPTWGHIEWMV